jgi:hypothetical protein
VMGMVEEETCKYKEAVKAKEVVVTYWHRMEEVKETAGVEIYNHIEEVVKEMVEEEI